MEKRIFKGALPLAFAVFLLATSGFRASNSSAQLVFPLIGQEAFKLSSARLGLLLSLSGGLGLLANFLFAYLAKRLSQERIGLILPMLLLLLSVLPVFSLASKASFIAAVLFYGFVVGLTTPSLISSAASFTGIQNPMAFYGAALSAGLVFGPLLTSGALFLFHGRFFSALVVVLLLGLLSAFSLFRAGITGQGVRRQYRSTHSVKSAVALAVVIQLLYEIPFIALTSFGGILGRRVEGLSRAEVTLAFSLMFFSSMLLRLLLVRIDMEKTARQIVICAMITTIAGLLLLEAKDPAFYFLGLVLLSVGHATTYPLSLTVIRERLHAEDLYRAVGLATAGIGVCAVVEPFLFGLAVSFLGYQGAFALLCIPVAILGLASMAVV